MDRADTSGDDDRRPYEVGYGRPPKHGQIKPGEIRNPNKRQKGTRSLRKEISEMLKMPVPMTQDGKVRHVTTRVASLMKLREMALKGDQRSLNKLLEYAAQQEDAAGTAQTTAALLAEDEKLLAHARERDAGSPPPSPPPSIAKPDSSTEETDQ